MLVVASGVAGLVEFVDLVLVVLVLVVVAGGPRSGSTSSFCGDSDSRSGRGTFSSRWWE